jgi:hypothetical protein
VTDEQLVARLRARASARRVVVVRGDVLAAEIGITTSELGLALTRMEQAGLLRMLSPLPFLVLKLAPWPGHTEKAAESAPAAYSYSFRSNTAVNKSYRHPPDAALLREILDTLGESNPASFEGAIRHFSPAVIRKALDRVRRAKSLRKNRTALFRYLLTRLA